MGGFLRGTTVSQFILKTFLVLTLLILSDRVLAQEVIVHQRPTYQVGDSFAIDIVTEFGRVSISTTATREVEKGRRMGVYTEFEVVVMIGGVEMFRGPGFMSKETWNGYLVRQGVMYRSTSTVHFPLREGDRFTNQVLVSGPCANYPGKTCMNIAMSEECHSMRRVAQGIEYICDGSPGGRIRYVMDHDFKWPVEFEVLN